MEGGENKNKRNSVFSVASEFIHENSTFHTVYFGHLPSPVHLPAYFDHCMVTSLDTDNESFPSMEEGAGKRCSERGSEF